MKIEDPIFCTIPCTELVKRELKADMHTYIKARNPCVYFGNIVLKMTQAILFIF